MRRPSYAAIAATAALVLAASGTGAYAAAQITGKDVKNGSLTGKDVKSGSLAGKQVRTGSLTGQDLKDKTVGLADLRPGALPGAAAGLLGDLEIPQGPSSSVAFDAELYDTADMYDEGDSVITVPRDGTYLVVAELSWDGGANAQRQVRILVDGEILRTVGDSSATSLLAQQATATLPLEAGDEVALGSFLGVGPVPVVDWTTDSPGAALSVQMVSP